MKPKFLKAGETLQYIITDYYQKTRSKNNRAIPIELIMKELVMVQKGI